MVIVISITIFLAIIVYLIIEDYKNKKDIQRHNEWMIEHGHAPEDE